MKGFAEAQRRYDNMSPPDDEDEIFTDEEEEEYRLDKIEFDKMVAEHLKNKED